MAYIIYICSIVVNCLALLSADIYTENWQYWISLACIITAYICGTESM
jgi:hypothetical protein